MIGVDEVGKTILRVMIGVGKAGKTILKVMIGVGKLGKKTSENAWECSFLSFLRWYNIPSQSAPFNGTLCYNSCFILRAQTLSFSVKPSTEDATFCTHFCNPEAKLNTFPEEDNRNAA